MVPMTLPERSMQFRSAEPFPHMVIDDLFDPTIVAAAARQVPGPKHRGWLRYRNKVDSDLPPKLGITKLVRYPAINRLAKLMLSQEFTDWLSATSGIPDLIADATLAGAGLHGVIRGGLLGIHVDFDRLGPLYRRLNTFVYLNPDWEVGWGGALELHPPERGPVVYIPPTLGRFVAFETSERSWHGHPTALRCPKMRLRASLAVYFYSRERPSWYVDDHSTIYRRQT